MSPRQLTLDLLPETFAIARLQPGSPVPAWAQGGVFVSVTRTPAEVSIVCAEASVPAEVEARRTFRCLRVLGPIEFGEIGVLEALARPLARAAIGIFALSTYDTDYLLFEHVDLEAALLALTRAGHTVRRTAAA